MVPDKTDDAAFLQGLIDATPIGGTLMIPPGEYHINRSLVIDKPMTLDGGGRSRLLFPADDVTIDIRAGGVGIERVWSSSG